MESLLSYDIYDLEILTPSKNKIIALIAVISKSTICHVQIEIMGLVQIRLSIDIWWFSNKKVLW